MKKKLKRGAPEKFTTVAANRIVQNLALGGTIETACSFAGISDRTYFNWMKKGERQKSGQFHDFFQQVRGATGTWVTRALLRVNKGEPNWQSSAWLLERRLRTAFARSLELSGPNGDPIRTESSVVVYLPANDRDPLLDVREDDIDDA